MEDEELLTKAELALNKNPEDRTYEDRFEIWCYNETKAKDSGEDFHYDEGEEVCIYEGDKLANNEIKDGFGKDFPKWFRECGKHFGEMVTILSNSYKLVGMMYTYIDYYYILEDKSGKRIMESCSDGGWALDCKSSTLETQ